MHASLSLPAHYASTAAPESHPGLMAQGTGSLALPGAYLWIPGYPQPDPSGGQDV